MSRRKGRTRKLPPATMVPLVVVVLLGVGLGTTAGAAALVTAGAIGIGLGLIHAMAKPVRRRRR